MLRKNFFSADQLVAIVKDFRNAGLPQDEVAAMSLAQKVITCAYEVSEKDIEDLRACGLSDEEILDIVLASSASNFLSKTIDAVNTGPDDLYLELEPDLLRQLTIGRPFP